MLNSDWLLRMLAKSGKRPQQRLLALFDILEDWVDAPLIRQNLINSGLDDTTEPKLLAFLEQEANKAGADHPQEIAHQLHLMALGALHQEIMRPGCGALMLGKRAADTLLRQQLAKPAHITLRPRTMAASVTVIMLTALTQWPMLDRTDAPLQLLNPQPIATATQPPLLPAAVTISPDQMAGLYYSIEQLRHGTCQYPQALMLPEKHRKLYLDTVVGGVISADPAQIQDLRQLLQKVDCYYPSQLNSMSVGARHYSPSATPGI